MSTSFVDKENLLTNNQILQQYKKIVLYLLSKIFIITILAILGAIIGFFIAYSKKTEYIAKTSFIVEEGKTSVGGFSGIASQLGVDINSLSGVGGASIFTGDNILLFLKSETLSKETLLSSFADSSSVYSLADRYADVYNLRTKWLKSKKIGKEVFFPPLSAKVNYTRLQDSLLKVIVSKIVNVQLDVDRPEKKATLINVSINSFDDHFSKLFCERLVQKATERYIIIKTKRQKANVERLERRADSIAAVLNRKTFSSAVQQEKLLDVNPGSKSATVAAEVSGRDKVILTTLYGEVIKNLELSKISLNQETPIIQLIDTPGYPLMNNKASKLIYMFIGGLIATCLVCFYLIFIFSLKNKN